MKNVVAVGNFDGVHLGHRLVFERTVKLARELGCGTVAFTFDNHPRNFFEPGSVKLLRSRTQKERIILSCGIDRVVSVPFDRTFSEQTPEAFLQYLQRQLNCTAVVCGENFQFGHLGAGSSKNLHELAARQGMQSRVVSLEKNASGVTISSSLIRQQIACGDVLSAGKLLGEPYTLSGKIIHGRQFGRKIGFPTMNFPFPAEFVVPRLGVYSTPVKVGEQVYPAVTNIGVCPTVTDSEQITVESHIIGTRVDLYGACADVLLYSFLRPEKKFSDSFALQTQIAADMHFAEEQLKALQEGFIDFE